MSDIAATAERLRVVKDACMDFITLWAIDELMAEDRPCDRIQGDLLNATPPFENFGFSILHSNRGMTD